MTAPDLSAILTEWRLAHEADTTAAPTPLEAYENGVADEHRRDAADAALLAALQALE